MERLSTQDIPEFMSLYCLYQEEPLLIAGSLNYHTSTFAVDTRLGYVKWEFSLLSPCNISSKMDNHFNLLSRKLKRAFEIYSKHALSVDKVFVIDLDSLSITNLSNRFFYLPALYPQLFDTEAHISTFKFDDADISVLTYKYIALSKDSYLASYTVLNTIIAEYKLKHGLKLEDYITTERRGGRNLKYFNLSKFEQLDEIKRLKAKLTTGKKPKLWENWHPNTIDWSLDEILNSIRKRFRVRKCPVCGRKFSVPLNKPNTYVCSKCRKIKHQKKLSLINYLKKHEGAEFKEVLEYMKGQERKYLSRDFSAGKMRRVKNWKDFLANLWFEVKGEIPNT